LQHGAQRSRTVPLSAFTRESLSSWWEDLRKTRTISTSRLYVGAVRSAWEWAFDSDTYGEHTPRPRRFTMPTPSAAHARAPTWEEMDAAIHACDALAASEVEASANNKATLEDSWTWRRRLLVVLRCTGLRVHQAMRLQWSDLDLERRTLTVRGELGKSRAERSGRVVPIAPVLADELAGWGIRTGALLAPWKKSRTADTMKTTRVWAASNVDPRVWGAPAGSDKGQPHHAFRKGFKTGLARLGVAAHVRDYLVGHHRGIDAAYLDTFEEAREAVALLPPIAPRVATVLPLRAEQTPR
jgi:integrase